MARKAKKTVSGKQLGAESSQARAALIEAAEHILHEEGYVGLTARRIAAQAGLGHQLIYYYFETLDELLVAVLHSSSKKGLERLEAVMASANPVRGLWEVYSDPRMTKLVLEFMALSNSSETIRKALASYWSDLRKRQVEAMGRYFDQAGVKPVVSPLVAHLLMVALARLIGNEESLDYYEGHAEVKALVEGCLRELEQADTSAAKVLFPRVDTKSRRSG